MQVRGNIGSDIRVVARKDGSGNFFSFRLAETTGREQYKQTTWYEVTAFIKEDDAAQLHKGARVTINGTVHAQAYLKHDGTPGVALALTTGFVKVEPPRPRAAGAQAEDAADAAAERDYDAFAQA
jgi:single-stranded DNA-binding protein